MKCVNCGASMTTARENAPYTALPGTVLVGVQVIRCASCGEHEVAIPAIEALDRALTEAVIRKPGRLTGPEIRFLRGQLGYTGAELAKLIGSDPASISRWESGRQALGHHTDLLLRAIVILDGRADGSTLTLREVTGERRLARYAFKRAGAKWIPARPR